MYTYAVKLNRVIDGDTIKADIDLGFGIWLRKVSIRFKGINAPEVRTRNKLEKVKGFESKAIVMKLLKGAKKITINVYKIGKFGRPIADVFADDLNVNEYLVANGFAVAKEY